METINGKPTDIKQDSKWTCKRTLVLQHESKKEGRMLPHLTSAGICCTVHGPESNRERAPTQELTTKRQQIGVSVNNEEQLYCLLSWRRSHFQKCLQYTWVGSCETTWVLRASSCPAAESCWPRGVEQGRVSGAFSWVGSDMNSEIQRRSKASHLGKCKSKGSQRTQTLSSSPPHLG